MIDPIVQKILLGTAIYGITILNAAGLFQLYRKEKKSAAALLSLGAVMLLLFISVRIIKS